MNKSDLYKIITECIKEVLEEGHSDPDREEMLSFLKSQFGKEAGFEDDAEVAIYWFANHHHGGQWSNLYSVLSTSPFSPGPISRGPEKDSMEELMYNSLVDEFGGGTVKKEIQDPRFQTEPVMKAVNTEGEEKPWTEIDHGFYKVDTGMATKLAGGNLPKTGYEKLVRAPAGFPSSNGFVWLAQTKVRNEMVWSIRDAKGWRMENGVAVFGFSLQETYNRGGDVTDFEQEWEDTSKKLEMIKRVGLEHEYETLMDGIFRLPLAQFDARAKKLEALEDKARQMDKEMKEVSTTGGVAGYQSKNAFSKTPSKRAMDVTKKMGYTPVKKNEN